MKRSRFIYLLFIILFATGCKKEAAIESATEFKPFYTLPQGNHPYDEAIMDFYHTYGCYILYKFSEADFKWNINSYSPYYTAEQGDENYITQSLTALNQYLFKFYTTDFLKKALPYKILLSSKITRNNSSIITTINSFSTSSHFAFGRAGSSLAGMTEAELKTLKGDLNREFWTQAITYDKIALPPLFVSATNYSIVTAANRRTHGVFTLVSGQQTLKGDFLDYINNIVMLTPQQWEQTVFTATNDPAGKFRQKYNAIINYFKEKYGVDLQAISQG